MNKITLILGGARSGKSGFAVNLAKESGAKTAFIATCMRLDKEMKERVALHKKSRPTGWKTFECGEDILEILKKLDSKFDVILIDCLTLFISSLLLKGLRESSIEKKIGDILAALKKINARTIIVSNEVGLGIVPANKLARNFRDIAGRINQSVAGSADEVFFMVSGIPWKVK